MPSHTTKGDFGPPPVSFFHTKKLAIMKASIYARIRRDKPSKEGTAAVYLQLRINGESDQIPLQISWPIACWDNSAGEFLPRQKGDTEADDLNLYLKKELGKANEIFIRYRLSNRELNVERFLREYRFYDLRKDFLAWSEQDNEDRYNAGKIKNQTFKNIKSQLKTVREWKETIPFGELKKEYLETLEAWLRNKKNLEQNSIWAVMKTMKSQAKRAFDDQVSFDVKSVQLYRLPATHARITHLKPAELEKLWKYLFHEEIPPAHFKVLRMFLFSTLTGLRVSDLYRVSWKHIQDDELTFEPWKTRGMAKFVSVPIPEDAWLLIENSKGLLFSPPTEQESNRTLKEIATACGIRKNLTMHVARHTFATEFLRKGGQIYVLQQLMGHSKITTTMVYVHVDSSMKRQGMELMRAPVSIAADPTVIGKFRPTSPRAA